MNFASYNFPKKDEQRSKYLPQLPKLGKRIAERNNNISIKLETFSKMTNPDKIKWLFNYLNSNWNYALSSTTFVIIIT